jgi:YD repeat-containing protein
VKSPNGDTDSYTYEGNPLEAGSYKMEISTKDKNGKVIFTKSITVLTKLRNGILAKEKESTSVNGSVHREQYYDDCCANPIRVKDGSGETSYRYDDSGLMLEKITKLETLKIQYSPTCRLPVRIDHLTSAKNSSETRWTEISYDSQCRAIAGKTSSHQSFSASYDGQDRPISISLGSKPIQRWELVYKNSGSIPDQIKDSTSGLNKNDPTEIKKILARASQQISKILSETRLANTDF